MSLVSQSSAWQALAAHANKLGKLRILDLFAADPHRQTNFSLELDGLYLDFSKQAATPQTLALLLGLARQTEVETWRERLFSGEAINTSENRAVLHMALRADLDAAAFDTAAFNAQTRNAPSPMHERARQIRDCQARMGAFVHRARAGELRGTSNQSITDIVNLGIGGSDLGPRLVSEALAKPVTGKPRVHYVANIDPAELDEVLCNIDPKNTLFIIASKTFTTLETMHNARRAKAWLGGESACVGQFAAITANVSAAREFGIVEENIFPIWDWVGGRFSLWSAMGLSAAIAMGEEAFDAMLAGAHRMDEHFQSAPPAANMPVLLALLSIWNINFRGALSHAILPYSHALRRLPAYLQQLEMESNGKRVDRTGQVLDYHTAPVIWGSEGSVSQHSFHQLLHQGTQEIPVDFIIPLDAPGERASRELLIGNAVAQGAALLSGTPAGTTAHSVSPGNRPSTTLLLDRLSPERLGQLLALYEHKVFVQGIIWNINSFDQWGVELGKTLANNIASGKSATMLDPSTRELLQRIRHE